MSAPAAEGDAGLADARAAPAGAAAGGRFAHVPALDGLRGLAVGAVLAYHGGMLTGGWLGVDLFFVLSGYLITSLLLVRAGAGGRVDPVAFWARRVRRLGPALVIALVGVAAYSALVALPIERSGIRADGIATLFEVANWRTILAHGDYWATGLRPSPLRHTWSLSIEEQLYLAWPLAVAGLLRWRNRPAVVAVAAGVGALASAGWMILLQARGADVDRLYLGTDTRASALLLGAALAGLRLHLGPRRWAATRPARRILGALAALLLALAWVRLSGTSSLPYRGVLPLAGLAGALVVAALADRGHPGPLGRALGWPPLAGLGRISYGLYLYHWPIFLVLDQARTGLDGWPLFLLRSIVSIAAAAASYRFVERPVRDGWPVGPTAPSLIPAGAAVALLALLAGSVGAIGRPSTAGAGTLQAGPIGSPTIVLAGDSVPLLLGVELADQRDELGISVVNGALAGCHLLAADGPIRGVEGDVRTDVSDCAADHAYRALVERNRPTVSVLFFGEFPNEAVRLDGRWEMPCAPAYLDAWRRRVEAAVDDLRATDAPVVLLTAPGSSVSWVLARVAPGMAERVACTNQVLVDIAHDRPGVAVVDLAAHVCPAPDRCLDRIDGANLRPDTLHFQGEGAAVINRWLVPKVLAAADGA